MAYPSPAQSDNSTHSVDYYEELFRDKTVIRVDNWEQTTGKPLLRHHHNMKLLLFQNFQNIFPHLNTIDEFYRSFPTIQSMEYIDLIHYYSLIKIYPTARTECICSKPCVFNFGIIYFKDDPDTLYLIGRNCLDHFKNENGEKLIDTSKKCHRCRKKLGRQKKEDKDRPICTTCIALEQQHLRQIKELNCIEQYQRHHIDDEFLSSLAELKYQFEAPKRIAQAKFNNSIIDLIKEEEKLRNNIIHSHDKFLIDLNVQKDNLLLLHQFKVKMNKRRQYLLTFENRILDSGVNKGKSFIDIYNNHKTFKPWLANRYPTYGQQYKDLYRFWLVKDNQPLPEETNGPTTTVIAYI